jgi:hypothetical protein
VRLVLLCLGVFALPSSAIGKCGSGFVSVFPATDVPLPTNGRIVLESDPYFELEGGASPWPPMELRREAERIPLKVLTAHGGVGVVQVVLAPDRELRPLTRYELHFAHAGDPPESYPGGKADRWTMSWTTASGPDHIAPLWKSAPKLGRDVNRLLPCGPEISVEVQVAFAHAEPVQILAELRPIARSPIGSSRPSSYLLRLDRGLVRIGRGMCGGAFQLVAGSRYSLKLSAVDAAGNSSRAPGRAIEIVGPARSTKSASVRLSSAAGVP